MYVYACMQHNKTSVSECAVGCLVFIGCVHISFIIALMAHARRTRARRARSSANPKSHIGVRVFCFVFVHMCVVFGQGNGGDKRCTLTVAGATSWASIRYAQVQVLIFNARATGSED